jgi:hypothetical protein
MFVRIVCIAALATGPLAAPAFAAEAMPAPSAAASAHCAEMAAVHVEALPASAWAAVAYPDGDEQALRAKGADEHPAKAPSVRVFRRDGDGSATSSIVAERGSGGWTLWVTIDRGGKITSRKTKLNADRARNLNTILGDACFYAEPADLSSERDQSACVDAIEFHMEAVTEKGRRSAVQRCSPLGLTGQAAEILWNEADVD